MDDRAQEALAAEKAAARKVAFSARKAAHAAGGAAAAEAAAARFLADVEVGAGLEVSAYRPIRTEIDPTPIMAALHAAGVLLSVPEIIANGAPLAFRRWTPDSVMVEGPFGAAIPENAERVTPRLLIAPLVAFDESGVRLGYGGGFYDRTVAEIRATGAATFVGFAYEGQAVASLPTGPTDLRLDAVVTETRVRRF